MVLAKNAESLLLRNAAGTLRLIMTAGGARCDGPQYAPRVDFRVACLIGLQKLADSAFLNIVRHAGYCADDLIDQRLLPGWRNQAQERACIAPAIVLIEMVIPLPGYSFERHGAARRTAPLRCSRSRNGSTIVLPRADAAARSHCAVTPELEDAVADVAHEMIVRLLTTEMSEAAVRVVRFDWALVVNDAGRRRAVPNVDSDAGAVSADHLMLNYLHMETI